MFIVTWLIALIRLEYAPGFIYLTTVSTCLFTITPAISNQSQASIVLCKQKLSHSRPPSPRSQLCIYKLFIHYQLLAHSKANVQVISWRYQMIVGCFITQRSLLIIEFIQQITLVLTNCQILQSISKLCVSSVISSTSLLFSTTTTTNAL